MRWLADPPAWVTVALAVLIAVWLAVVLWLALGAYGG